MTNFPGENLNAACGGPQGGGMDSRRNGVAEVSPKYLADVSMNSVPVGYKQTEVGVIPEDWEVCSLPDVIWYQEGPGLRKWQFKSKGLKVINVTNLQESGYLDLDKTDRHISWDEFEKAYKHFACDEGDLVIASSGNSYCKASIVRACDLPLLMNTSVIRFKPIGEFSRGYMEVYLKSPYFKDQVDLLITGGAQPNFGPAHLNLIKIPAPTCAKEQTAIANALSDVDALISELEKLIAKKQAIKTATMQQLLTGRTRLPPFAFKESALREDGTPKGTKHSELGEIPEDWEVDLLGTVCDSFKTGKLDANAMKPDGEYRFYTCAKEYSYIDKYAFDDEALLVSGNGANVGYVHYYKGKFNAYQRTYVLTSFLADVIYLKIYLEKKLAERIRVEVNAGNTPYITMDTLTDMSIVLPPKEEQTAIATILSDMDEELQALEQRLGKTRQIKQGMMQELLTGRIRLIKPSKEVIHE